MLSTLLGEQETLERGLHGLWEVACRPSNHAEISVATVDEMVGASIAIVSIAIVSIAIVSIAIVSVAIVSVVATVEEMVCAIVSIAMVGVDGAHHDI